MSKKILFIYYQNSKAGGVAKVLSNLSGKLAERGYTVEILFLVAPHKDFYTINPQVKKHYIDSFGDRYSKIATKIKHRYGHHPKMWSLHSYIYDYGTYRVLKAWLKNHQAEYDTIVSCWYKLSSMLSLDKDMSKKTIAWEHMSHLSGGMLWNGALRKYYKNLKGVVGTYKNGGNYYRNINPNYHTIYNMMDDYCENIPYIPASEKENIISIVARLDPEKNILGFLEIIKDTKFSKPWKIKIIGHGSQEGEIKKYIAYNKLENIKLFGSKNIYEVYDILKKSKINCLTSSVEALPTILIQAKFSSNALIAYDCNFGPGDIISEGCGYLIPLHDKNMFRQKLEYLDAHDDILNKMMKNAHDESRDWKQEKILNQWEKIL